MSNTYIIENEIQIYKKNKRAQMYDQSMYIGQISEYFTNNLFKFKNLHNFSITCSDNIYIILRFKNETDIFNFITWIQEFSGYYQNIPEC